MEQTERIRHMEQILDQATAAVAALTEALEQYQALLPALDELEAYYDGTLWRQDYEDDEAGRIPSGLKRGVLSEDAVYNLLDENRQLQEALRHFKTDTENGGTP